jgi:hypothetical protein
MRKPMANFVAALMSVMVLACAHAVSGPVQAAATAHGRHVVLAPGESDDADGLWIRFDAVVNDSRCPTGEQCVWAGSAEIAVTATAGGQSAAFHLCVGAEPRSATHGGFTIELQRLDPHPKGSRPIPSGEYRATFTVDRAPRERRGGTGHARAPHLQAPPPGSGGVRSSATSSSPSTMAVAPHTCSPSIEK